MRLEEIGAAERTLALGWRAGAGRERSLDGKTVRLGEQLAAFPLLAWTEAESALVAGGPSLRRRFFDRGMVLERPALLASLGRYERALAEKRALLAASGGTRSLAAWNELLAREGAVVAAAANEERARRQPLLGPHRDEIEILWDGAPARRAASAGERKAIGLLLVAALARRLGESAAGAPALLLDDADAELDRPRLARLLAAFEGFRRLLVSSNRPEVWPAAAGLTRVAVEALGEGAATAS